MACLWRSLTSCLSPKIFNRRDAPKDNKGLFTDHQFTSLSEKRLFSPSHFRLAATIPNNSNIPCCAQPSNNLFSEAGGRGTHKNLHIRCEDGASIIGG
jgi:hypothetical protein